MFKVIDHPLIRCKLSIMRDENTADLYFRNCLDEIASLMTFEALKDLKVTTLDATFRTPTGCTLNKIKLEKHITLAPVLRAGTGMVEGVRKMIPNAHVGYIGMYRDEKTLKPVEYFFKMPNDKDAEVIILDPMCATGGSLVEAIDSVIAHGFHNIRCMCLIAAPEGVKFVESRYPNIDVYVAAIDDKLNDVGYILPGLGDAGDRIFGTK